MLRMTTSDVFTPHPVAAKDAQFRFFAERSMFCHAEHDLLRSLLPAGQLLLPERLEAV